MVRLAMEGKQPSACQQAEWGVSVLDALLRLRKPAGSGSAALNGERSTCAVMGLFEAWHCATVEVELAPGNTLLLYADESPKQRTRRGKSLARPTCWTPLSAILICRRDPFSNRTHSWLRCPYYDYIPQYSRASKV